MSNTTNPLDMATEYLIEAEMLDAARIAEISQERASCHITYKGSNEIYMSITRCGFRTNNDGVTTLNFDWDSEDGYGSVSAAVAK